MMGERTRSAIQGRGPTDVLLALRHDGDAAAGRCWSGCGLLTGCVRQRLKAVAKADYSFRTPSLSPSTSPVGPSFRRPRVLTITPGEGLLLFPLLGDHGPDRWPLRCLQAMYPRTHSSTGDGVGLIRVLSAMARRESIRSFTSAGKSPPPTPPLASWPLGAITCCPAGTSDYCTLLLDELRA